jgi:hypothetical protein
MSLAYLDWWSKNASHVDAEGEPCHLPAMILTPDGTVLRQWVMEINKTLPGLEIIVIKPDAHWSWNEQEDGQARFSYVERDAVIDPQALRPEHLRYVFDKKPPKASIANHHHRPIHHNANKTGRASRYHRNTDPQGQVDRCGVNTPWFFPRTARLTSFTSAPGPMSLVESADVSRCTMAQPAPPSPSSFVSLSRMVTSSPTPAFSPECQCHLRASSFAPYSLWSHWRRCLPFNFWGELSRSSKRCLVCKRCRFFNGIDGNTSGE